MTIRAGWITLAGRLATFVATVVLLMVVDARAFQPEELLVVANTSAGDSVRLAEKYASLRNIPRENVLLARMPVEETISRKDYVEWIRKPVAAKLERLRNRHDRRIEAIVLMYGVPLRVRPPEPDWEEKKTLWNLRKQQEDLTLEVEAGDEKAKELLEQVTRKIQGMKKDHSRASVDSELSMVRTEDYPLKGWIPNPYFLGYDREKLDYDTNQVMLVSRLDGPDPETVEKMMADTLHAEERGLDGVAYIDARWPQPKDAKPDSAYGQYDASLHAAAGYIRERMEVILDDNQELFPEGCCDRAALYCGWYSLAQYRDSFNWSRGAIGYHIASAECSTLKNTTKNVWCLRMLEKGAAATIGPVYEPYVQGFPVPEMFFAKLVEGYMSLGEAYLVSLPFVSWQMVLVGDPLYQPFRP